ncbi:hypothetical protein MVEN_02406500 [Mycena venus]|uniref:F-box domain-containing protein n=1 Tax=Mycena venus TaxID=2733690 RepID=A0A8H6X243_9AGAR|nr:hypothetical protein MVEN_02406500 [Mycena venus]
MTTTLNSLVCESCGSTSFRRSRIYPHPTHVAELREILRGNIVPPAPLKASLRDDIHRAPGKLERYDAEIQKLQKILSGLISERDSLVAHVEACGSVFASIRRLPMELLTEIFGMCSIPRSLLSSITPKAELDRLARRDLLELSQVSFFWHKIAIGTPKLWSDIVSNTSLWRYSPAPPATFISLLASSLTRSGDHPLKLRVKVRSNDPGARPALDLLCQHARRWRDVYFWADRNSGQYLAGAKGNLSTLNTLCLSANLDVFEVAPALTTVFFSGQSENIQRTIKLPWSQIRAFVVNDPSGLVDPTGLFLVQSLGIGAAFRFRPNGHVLNIPSVSPWSRISSNIHSLSLELGIDASPPVQKLALGQILESLTLPYIVRLDVITTDGRKSAGVWHQEHFLAFAQRSSLHSHLIFLDIRVQITDEELLECLSALPLLEELTISEQKTPSTHVSVTDTFLRGLTWNSDGTSLIPNLRSLSLKCRLRFTDDIYWDFVASRAIPGRNPDGRTFTTELRRLTHYDNREFSLEVRAKLTSLVSLGVLRFTGTIFKMRGGEKAKEHLLLHPAIMHAFQIIITNLAMGKKVVLELYQIFGRPL